MMPCADLWAVPATFDLRAKVAHVGSEEGVHDVSVVDRTDGNRTGASVQ
jgi:hypothetical protein